jgi:uncharacterized SAM-binding protein YcdF (DUF218 family)
MSPGTARRRIATASTLAMVGLLAWSLGLVWFVCQAERVGDLPPSADGIVALTGGAERVTTALRLLAEGRGPKLLITGVGGAAALDDFAREAGVDPLLLASRVTLGRSALSTRGNAEETASWVRENGLRSLLVVTASYHMPRAMLELSRALPETKLYPVPVLPPALRDTPDWPTLRLLAGEYSKWLIAWTGLSRLAEAHEVEVGRHA